MHFNVISFFDAIGLCATVAALVACISYLLRIKRDRRANIILLLVLFSACYEGLLLIEWLGISQGYDPYENYVGATLPLWWLFTFYILTQSTLMDQLAENEERLKQAMDATSDGLWDWNIRTGEIFFSPHWYGMLGYAPSELPSEYATWQGLLHPDDAAAAEAEVNRHLDLDTAFESEFRMRTKSGGWLWVLGRGKVVARASDGAPLRMVGTHVDISNAKLRESKIQALQLYLSSIINSMPSVLVGVDSNEQITLWNKRAECDTGLCSTKATGTPLEEAFPRLAGDVSLVRLALQSGQTQTISHRVRQKGSERRYEDIAVYPLKDHGLEGVVIRVDDVTEKMRIEEMLIQSEKMLSLGGLAAGMAHEINNPLSVITGSADNIMRRIFGDLKKNEQAAEECGALLEKVQAYAKKRDIDAMLENIIQAGARTAKIVNNMLGFSRKSTQEAQPVNIAELLDNTVELAVSDYETRKIGLDHLDITREYQPDVPVVFCDRSKIQQVLFNILRNGVEAMAEKTYRDDRPRFTLRLGVEPCFLVIEIEDNGPGMDEKTRNQVFNAFFTTKESGKGTGLGLSISYFIVTELHNGKMEVSSISGESTCFTVKLPIETAEIQAPAA